MPDLIHDPLFAPLFAAGALVAVLSFGYALLGAAAWLLDGHRPRNRLRSLRRAAVIGTRHDPRPQPRPADVRRQLRSRQQRAVAAARRVC